ncbi:MAG: UDP-N-acetylmuramate--L-alanine ligase [Candidatus Pacebacteria bacterium]|nr:UDP-N-acetylmuramate--L-alanine ligase [Candidatus Paceibacterota bacterium]
MDFKNIKHIYFIGIGGSGLSPLAKMCFKLGIKVSGSDIKESEETKNLQKQGIVVNIGHKKENIVDNIDLVIFTSAVIGVNPEIEQANKKGIPAFKRDFLVKELMKEKIGICVAGTHGKTTITAMTVHILKYNKIDPSFLIGGISKNYKTDFGIGKDYFVIEADEFDNAFLALKPNICCITSIEMDHPDCFDSLKKYVNSFKRFIQLVPKNGLVIGCGDWAEIKKILFKTNAKTITYGKNSKNNWYFKNVRLFPGKSSFDVYNKNKRFDTFELNIPGEHNITNALVPIIIGTYLGISKKGIRQALKKFQGAKRRFDILGKPNNIIIAEDYAHHPTAVYVTLQAALTYNRPVKAVYEPHQYARTALLLNDYKGVFNGANKVYLSKIFAARDKDIYSISSKDLLKIIKKDGIDAEYIDDVEKLVKKVVQETKPGELVIVMGVGNGDIIAKKIMFQLKQINT